MRFSFTSRRRLLGHRSNADPCGSAGHAREPYSVLSANAANSRR